MNKDMAQNQQLITIIDDDVTAARVIGMALEAAGYRVIQAPDGKSGAEALHQEMPALLLLDYKLPDTNGLELLKKLRSEDQFAKLPVILSTNTYEVDIMNQVMELGVRDYVLKSDIQLDEIVRLVGSYLASPSH